MTEKRPLKIAVVVKRFVRTGGSERYAVEITRRMVQRGHQVDLYARVADPQLISGIRWHQVPDRLSVSSVLSSVAFAGDTARMLADKTYAVVHSHERGWHQDILTVHTFTYKYGVHDKSFWKKLLDVHLSPRSQLYLWLEKRQMTTPWLVPTGDVVRQDIVDHYQRQDGVITIIPGVDIQWFHPRWVDRHRTALRARQGLSAHDTVVVFVGSEFRRKGLDYLIPALDQSMRLMVVGKGERMAHYQRLAQRHGVADRITFTGLLENVRDAFAVADMVVLPSLREAFGMTILEAMACGRCVITTANTGVSSLIQNGVNGLIAPDHGRIRETLARAMDPDLRRQLGNNARNTAEHYTWDHAADQYEQMYYKIAESPPHGR